MRTEKRDRWELLLIIIVGAFSLGALLTAHTAEGITRGMCG